MVHHDGGGACMALLTQDFPKQVLPALLRRYDFTYFREETCVEYAIAKKGTTQRISQAIVFSLNRPSQQIHVSKFYPELYKQVSCKYLSAACFYLLVHHFANLYRLPNDYRICLESLPDIFDNFYSKLRDFHLHIQWIELCKTAHICGTYPGLHIDVSQIKRQDPGSAETPFLI